MASLNKVQLIGNLGADPETRTFQNGDQIANAPLATTDQWKDKQTGERREHTEWHRLVFNGKLAEVAAQYLRKGSQVYVEGSLKYDKFTGQDGVEKYTTDIVANEMQMLGGRQEGGEQRQQQQRPARQQAAPTASQTMDDLADDSDIPF